MPRRSESVDFKISKRILSVGGEFYPLRNITRARIVRLPSGRARVAKQHVLLLVGLGFIGPFGTVILFLAAGNTTGNAFFALSMAVIALSWVRFIAGMRLPPLFGLVVETSGQPFAVLASPDHDLVSSLAAQVVAALDNPDYEFHMLVRNVYHGDVITQTGDRSVGKVII